MLVPTKDDFQRLTAGASFMPVYRDVLADMETPLSAYWKLGHDETHSFLLESVTGGEQLARYSIIGVRPRLVLRTKDRKVRRITPKGETREDLAGGRDPLHLLEDELAERGIVHVPGLPKFVGGAVGMLSYDLVRFFEKLPDGCIDDLKLDDMAMMLADTVVVFDHAKNVIRIIVLAEASNKGYEQASAEIERVLGRLRRPLPELPSAKLAHHLASSNMPRPEYEAIVRRVVEYIAAGDGVQMVPSQRFQTRVEAHPLSVYRALRSLNPSPYMFLVRYGDFDIVGASPSSLSALTTAPRASGRSRARGREATHPTRTRRLRPSFLQTRRSARSTSCS